MARLTEIEAAEALLSAANVLIVQVKNGVQTEQLATLTQLSGVIATLLGSSTFAAKTHTHAMTDITELVNSLGGKADDIGIDETTGLLYLYSDGEPITSGMQISTDSGLSFDGGYVDTIDGENFLHLTLEGEDIEGFDPIRLPAGGGGGSGEPYVIELVPRSDMQSITAIKHGDTSLTFTEFKAAIEGKNTEIYLNYAGQKILFEPRIISDVRIDLTSVTFSPFTDLLAAIYVAVYPDYSQNSAEFIDIQNTPADIVEETAPTAVTLEDNTEYYLTGVSALTLTYPSGRFECFITLSTASSGAVSVTFPSGTKYAGTAPVFGNGEEWEISIKNGIVVAAKVGDGT